MNGDMSNNGTSPKVTTPNATAGSSISLAYIIVFVVCVAIMVALFITLIVMLVKKYKDKKEWEGKKNNLESEKIALENEKSNLESEKITLANEKNNLENEKIDLEQLVNIAEDELFITEKRMKEMTPSPYWPHEFNKRMRNFADRIYTLRNQIKDLKDINQNLQTRNSLLLQDNSDWQTYSSQHDEESQTYYKQWEDYINYLLKQLETVRGENVILQEENQALQTENLKLSRNL